MHSRFTWGKLDQFIPFLLPFFLCVHQPWLWRQAREIKQLQASSKRQHPLQLTVTTRYSVVLHLLLFFISSSQPGFRFCLPCYSLRSHIYLTFLTLAKDNKQNRQTQGTLWFSSFLAFVWCMHFCLYTFCSSRFHSTTFSYFFEFLPHPQNWGCTIKFSFASLWVISPTAIISFTTTYMLMILKSFSSPDFPVTSVFTYTTA